MDARQTSVSVLIPACNEEGALAGTIAAIEKHRALFGEMEIIVINDGSRDRTGEVARALSVTLIEHETNQGYGASLKEGLQRANGEFILIADADGTYPLADIPRLAADITAFDMVIGARTGDIVKIPFLRRLGK